MPAWARAKSARPGLSMWGSNFAPRNKRQGMTLGELLVASSIFLLVLGMVVGIMVMGVRMFHHASLRQGIEGDARRIAARLRQDLATTDFRTVSSVTRTVATDRRDGLAMAALSDWNEPTKFDAIGLPKWDRYKVYYATQESPGRLIRQEVNPSGMPTDGWVAPYANLSLNLQDNPQLNLSVLNSNSLSDIVVRFTAEPDFADNTVTVNCRLRKIGPQKAQTLQRADENLEFRLLLKARNTWPDI